MDRIEILISKVENTCKEFIAGAAGLSQVQAEFKPNPDAGRSGILWSILFGPKGREWLECGRRLKESKAEHRYGREKM